MASLEAASIARMECLRDPLSRMTPWEIDRLMGKGSGNLIVEDSRFTEWLGDRYGCFYAPFDWVNEDADVVLIGITPGMRQARMALETLRDRLRAKASIEDAARAAKMAASFEGSMRTVAARLMDRFKLHEVFGLRSCADLFGQAASRAHYTSVLRYPVLQRKARSGAWTNYSGGSEVSKHPDMRKMLNELFLPEIRRFPNAWLVPFGPIPAAILESLAGEGLVRRDRVLAGMNHPSGEQWNRHNCQLKPTGASHADCKPNVGCSTIRDRTMKLEANVGCILRDRQNPREGKTA